MNKKAIMYGKVNLVGISSIGDNVILGNKDDHSLEIGENAIIRSGTIVYSDVTIGNNFKTGHNAIIRENTKIGNNVLIGTNAVVDGNCTIGNNVSVQTGAYITKNTQVDDNVFLGPFCVTTNDKYMEYGAELKGPIIKAGARIGANATILPGVIIGRNAVVGAGAVVTRNVGDEDIVAGNPAKSIKARDK